MNTLAKEYKQARIFSISLSESSVSLTFSFFLHCSILIMALKNRPLGRAVDTQLSVSIKMPQGATLEEVTVAILCQIIYLNNPQSNEGICGG